MFNSIEEMSSSLTDPMMLRNGKGKLWDSTDEKVWSKRNNCKQNDLSLPMEHEYMVVTFEPCPREMDWDPFYASFPEFWMCLKPKVPKMRRSSQWKCWLFHLKYGVELILVHQVRRLMKTLCSLAISSRVLAVTTVDRYRFLFLDGAPCFVSQRFYLV